MISISASDVAKNFGEWHDKAMSEPVVVTKYGRESVVLLSVDTFKSLTANYREVVDTGEINDALANSIELSEIPEEYRWNSTDTEVPDSRRGF
jgi:antitoxin StbD